MMTIESTRRFMSVKAHNWHYHGWNSDRVMLLLHDTGCVPGLRLQPGVLPDHSAHRGPIGRRIRLKGVYKGFTALSYVETMEVLAKPSSGQTRETLNESNCVALQVFVELHGDGERHYNLWHSLLAIRNHLLVDTETLEGL